MTTNEMAEKIETLERVNRKLQGDNQLLTEKLSTLQTGMVKSALRASAETAGIRESAVEDVIMRAGLFEVAADGDGVVTKTGVGVTPGLTPERWLEQVKPQSPHWWGESKNGSPDVATANPWSARHWNKTEQGRIVRDLGEAKARQMATAAGVTIDAMSPAGSGK